jgi:hypothetical protein
MTEQIEYKEILAWRCCTCGTVTLPYKGKRPNSCAAVNKLVRLVRSDVELCGGTEWEPQTVLSGSRKKAAPLSDPHPPALGKIAEAEAEALEAWEAQRETIRR